MPKHIEVIARGVCIRADHILVCRNVAVGYCYLPGGHVEFGETSQEALARELVEEAGVKTLVGKLFGVDECRFEQKGKQGKSKPRHEFNLLYEVELLPRGTRLVPVPSLEAHITFEWLKVSDLKSANFKPESARLRVEKLLPRGKVKHR